MNNLNDITNHLSEREPRWFAVKTKFRGEKYVLKQLEEKGITAYLPLLSKTKVYHRKKRTTLQPLIHSHIFVQITKDQYIAVLETLHVFSFLKQGPHLVSIPDAEIELIKRVVGSNEEILINSDQLSSGDRVEVIGGNLTGLKGYLVRRENKNKFVVLLETMGVQLEIAINPKLLAACFVA